MPTPGTSESSPLRVAAVTPGEGHGRIGITMCPGKTDPAGMTGPGARDLDTDLDAVERWGATAVLLAANLADDADTVAAVTGQLAGALYGLGGIPDRWLDRLAWKDRLIDAGERLQRASLR